MSMAFSAATADPHIFWEQPCPASAAGHELSRVLAEVREYSRDVASDWRPLTSALIAVIATECAQPNWDGYGAKAISAAAKAQAQRFVDLMPFQIPSPDPAPDPSGDIGLVWDFGKGHVLTVNVAPNGMLNYAGLLGAGVKRHGVERLLGSIPGIILKSLSEVAERAGVTA